MKGKNPSAKQKEFHSLMASCCGCAACWIQYGQFNDYGSIHHCDGRVKDDAHWFVLFLCTGHHMKGTGPDPKMLSIHGDVGAFRDQIGTEEQLYIHCIDQMLEQGQALPDRVLAMAEEFRQGVGGL